MFNFVPMLIDRGTEEMTAALAFTFLGTTVNALAYADSATNLEWKINFGGDQVKPDTRHNLNLQGSELEELTLPSEED
jgi:hypothetical protein